MNLVKCIIFSDYQKCIILNVFISLQGLHMTAYPLKF
jgi:hypothetical protein